SVTSINSFRLLKLMDSLTIRALIIPSLTQLSKILLNCSIGFFILHLLFISGFLIVLINIHTIIFPPHSDAINDVQYPEPDCPKQQPLAYCPEIYNSQNNLSIS